MALFTYSYNPATSTLDTLRFLSGDTVEALALLTDDEARWLLTQYGTPQAALIPALRVMLAKCFHDTLTMADGIERDITERRNAITARLNEAHYEDAVLVPPFLGGVSIMERDALAQETDRIQPAFTVSRTPASPLPAHDEESA